MGSNSVFNWKCFYSNLLCRLQEDGCKGMTLSWTPSKIRSENFSRRMAWTSDQLSEGSVEYVSSLGTSPPSTHTAMTQVARGSSPQEVLSSVGSRYGRDVTLVLNYLLDWLDMFLTSELMPFTRSWLLKGISRIFICLILINFQLLQRSKTISTILWFSGKLHRTVAVRRQSKSHCVVSHQR